MPRQARQARSKKEDVQIASLNDGVGGVNVLLNMVRGKVASITFPLDQGDRVTIPSTLLRSAVEMIDDVDGG